MELLIKNVNVIDRFQNFHGEVYIKNGIISEIGKELDIMCDNTIDGEGYVLMPAFTDTHAHFREPGLTHKEDIETGSKAAVKGGFTGVCLMANTLPICSDRQTFDYINNKAKEVNLSDIYQCVSITKGFDGKTLNHLEQFYGDNNLKAISDDGVGVMDSSIMMKAMKIAKENDWIVMSHAEDKTFSKIDMRIAENLMTLRDIYLAKETGAKLHMAHVSTKEAVEYIVDAKLSGVNVTCEVTPHHIALTNDVSNYRVNPPIREKEDVKAIIKGIEAGFIDCIGTDHAPHTVEDKNNGAPGMVGLETAFSICYTTLVKENDISLNKLSELMSANPANILGLNKGTITIGKEADLVLVDLNKLVEIKSEEFVSKGKNTPFEGRKYFGEIVATLNKGRLVYKR